MTLHKFTSSFFFSDSFIYQDWRETEIRIVLLGKKGSGKSAIGNTILGEKSLFYSSASGLSVTSKCVQKHAVRFGRNIVVVDTPDILDTKESNEKIQNEICKCLGITSPGPHAFILVLSPSRYTREEQCVLKHFVKHFGEKFYNYLIILFTRKDYLYGVELPYEDHIKKCGGRVIAFNNRLKGEQHNAQVAELLSMILKNIKSNDVEYYTNEKYIEAENQLREREERIIKGKINRNKEKMEVKNKLLDKIESKIAEEAKRDKEMHQQCEGLLMKNPGEEKKLIHRRNEEDELMVQLKLRTDLQKLQKETEIDIRKLEMIQKTEEEKLTRIKEATEKEYLSTKKYCSIS